MDIAADQSEDPGGTATHSRPHATTQRKNRPSAHRATPTAEDVEHFLSLIGHELRTPLAVTQSAAETLVLLLQRDEVDRAELERITDVITRHSRLATRLVDRLSFAHRVGQGPVELVPERLDLAALVTEIVDDVAAFVLPARSVTVSSSGPVAVSADAAAISEIIFNLLANADKYSIAAAAIEVHVQQDTEVARIVVRDQGSGVAPGDTEAIFEPYVQSGPRRGGVGLGLYISRQLARAHGGELSVRPAADVGSEFVLELPVDAA